MLRLSKYLGADFVPALSDKFKVIDNLAVSGVVV